MKTVKLLFLGLLVITSYLQAQSYEMKITTKDGSHITISTESIRKMTFALDQTQALVISQRDGSHIESHLTNITHITFSQPTPVEERLSALDNHTFVLRQNYPNPFNPSTTIEYELPSPGWVGIQIFNVTGQLVRTLQASYCPGGVHRIIWNGEDDNQEPVANGVYFYKMQFKDTVQMKKLLLVR